MSKNMILSKATTIWGDNITYRFYDDHTYSCSGWEPDQYWGWRVTGNKVEFYRKEEWADVTSATREEEFVAFAREAHDVILFNKEVEELLSED